MIHFRSIKAGRVGRLGLQGLASMTVLAAATAASADNNLVAVPNTLRHPEATRYNTSKISENEDVFFAISIQPRDMAGLEKFAADVSNPASPNYRHFLTPQEVGAQFGPSQGDVDGTVAFLKEHGISVVKVASNNFVVIAEGPAKEVTEAFQTELGLAARPDGTTYRTNLTALHMPAEACQAHREH